MKRVINEVRSLVSQDGLREQGRKVVGGFGNRLFSLIDLTIASPCPQV